MKVKDEEREKKRKRKTKKGKGRDKTAHCGESVVSGIEFKCLQFEYKAIIYNNMQRLY